MFVNHWFLTTDNQLIRHTQRIILYGLWELPRRYLLVSLSIMQIIYGNIHAKLFRSKHLFAEVNNKLKRECLVKYFLLSLIAEYYVSTFSKSFVAQ